MFQGGNRDTRKENGCDTAIRRDTSHRTPKLTAANQDNSTPEWMRKVLEASIRWFEKI